MGPGFPSELTPDITSLAFRAGKTRAAPSLYSRKARDDKDIIATRVSDGVVGEGWKWACLCLGQRPVAFFNPRK